MNNFSKLGLSDKVVEVLNKLGFEKPTPIQELAIPKLLTEESTDFIGLAQTGTGKTAAFGLPLIDLIDIQEPSTQALIMAPTRELGQQTAQQLVQFASNNKKLNVEVVYGGASIVNQIRALKKPTQIVVATPGRLLDLINRRAIKLGNVKYVILDEADEMLNMGFKEDIDEILSHTREDRATWLFSATMPKEIRKIVKKYMDNPAEVSVLTKEKTNRDITHQFVITKSSNKVAAMRRFLDIMPEMRGIMFCRTRRETRQISEDLGNLGYNVEALHGDLSQAQRDVVMRRFKKRSMQLLVATDVAARGIDVNDLTHVMHHSLPDQLESYTHRSGRTARAGRKGISLVFISNREERRIKDLERRIGIKFEKIDIPTMQDLKSSRINNWANLIINTEVDSQADEILELLKDKFEHLSKEDILKRLITTQIDHSMFQSNEGSDLNESRNKSKGGRGSEHGDYHRFFINIGEIDGMTSGDLEHFLSDVSKVDRKHIDDISLQKNCAFFNIHKDHSSGFGTKFNGISFDGRDIRVNRDDDKNSKSKGKSGKGKGKRRSGNNFNGSGGRRSNRRGGFGGGGNRKKSRRRS